MRYCPICERTYGDEVKVCEIDGAVLRESGVEQDALIGKVIKGRYRVLEKLGQGGMGAVYLAEQIAVSRKVALKLLHPDYARDEEFVKRFRQEAKLAASLNHRNVITVFDFDQADDGSLYIVMEYINGRSLSEFIQNGPMDLRRALDLGIQIGEGLGAAHRCGVIHRDIKPDNIMVVEGGEEIKLMDFGIARLRDTDVTTRLTRAGMIMGTPVYMAPEQIQGGEVNEATDIYAFGIVLYEMLTGNVPFKAPTPGAILIKHLHEAPVPLRRVRKEIPASVEHVVLQALQKSPENRLRSMDEVVLAIKQAQRGGEQRSTGRVNPFAPQIAALQRGLGAVASPFKNLLRKTPADSAVQTRIDGSDLQNHQAVFGQHGRPPETSVQLTPLDERENRIPTAFREPASLSRVGNSEVAERSHKTELPVSARPKERQQHTTVGEDTETMGGPPAPEAITWPSQPDRTIVSPPVDDVWERQPATVAADIRAASRAVANETIAETAMVTQPVERVRTQKKGWMLAAGASVLAMLAAVLGGMLVFRQFTGPPVSTVKTEQPERREPVAPQPRTESRDFMQEFSDTKDEKSTPPHAVGVPEVKPKEKPPAKEPQTTKSEMLARKPAETASSSATTTIKKPDSPARKETKPLLEPGIATKAEQGQKPYSPTVVEVETPSQPASAGKKAPEPQIDPRVASLKKPEAPPPAPPPRVELKDLSITTNKRDLKVKERVILTVRGRYSDGKEMDIATGVQWKSSDSSVASVNSRGELEALKEGKAQISALYEGVASTPYTFNIKPGEESQKTEAPTEQIKDLRRRLLR